MTGGGGVGMKPDSILNVESWSEMALLSGSRNK
jgi:hypothetical protein